MNKNDEKKVLELFKKGKGKTLSEITSYMDWSLKLKKQNRDFLDKLVESGDLILSKEGNIILLTI